MSQNNILDPKEQNWELLARLCAGVKRKGDGKFYCPGSECMGFKMRRIKIKTTKRHCLQHGHVEVGHGYRPLVSSSLNMSLYWSFL